MIRTKSEVIKERKKMDQHRFEQAKEKIIGKDRRRQGIGTLREKNIHAILKHYYAPDEKMHEVSIENYVADIYTGKEIIEIQTRSFNKMREKLKKFLPLCPVTIVYPMPHEKWLIWIDEETGSLSPKRKSPKRGNIYEAFFEFYKIKQYLYSPNLHLKIVLLDMEEFRLLNGFGKDRKKGSSRYERVPLAMVEEVSIKKKEDFIQLVPRGLKEPFTSLDYAKKACVSISIAQTALNILNSLNIVERRGRTGHSYLYTIKE